MATKACVKCGVYNDINATECSGCSVLFRDARSDPARGGQTAAHRPYRHAPDQFVGPSPHGEACLAKIKAMLTGPRTVRYRTELGGADKFAEVQGFGMQARVKRAERVPGEDDE